MAATIEEFLVSLKFATDQGSYQQFLNTIEAITAKFTKIGASVVGVTTGIMLFAEKMAEAGDKLYWSSQRLGDSISNITAFASAMSTLGMSSAQAMNSLERFGTWMRSYGPAGMEFLRGQLGVTSTNPRVAMQQAAMALYNMGLRPGMEGTQQYAQARQWLSILPIDEQMVRTAPMQAERERRMLAVQASVWGGTTAATMGQAQFGQLSNDTLLKFAEIQEMFTNIAEKMAMDVYPSVQRFLDYFLSNAGPLTEFFDKIGKGLAFFVDHLVDFLNYVKQIPDAVKTMTEVFLGGAYGLKLLSSPLGMVIAGFTALLLLMDDYAAYQRQTPGGPHLSHFDWGPDSFMGKMLEFGKGTKDFAEGLGLLDGNGPTILGALSGLSLLAAQFALTGKNASLAGIAIRAMMNPWIGIPTLATIIGGLGMGWAASRGVPTLDENGNVVVPGDPKGVKPSVVPPDKLITGKTIGKSIMRWLGIDTDTPEPPHPQGDVNPDTRALILGMTLGRRGGTQIASADPTDWGVTGIDGATDQSSDLFQMLAEKLQGIWDTLTDMATQMGAGTETRAPGTSIAGPGGGQFAPAGTPISEAVPSTMEGRAAMLMQKVMAELGITQAEAAPIVSAFLRESGGFANISRGGKEGSYQYGTTIDVGLAQWVGSRHQALEAFAKSIGMAPEQVDTQIKFLHHELLTNPAFRNWLQVLRSANPEAWGDMYEAGGRRSWYNHSNYTDWLTHMNLNSSGGGGGHGGGATYNIHVEDHSGDPHRTAQLTGDAVRRVHQDQFRYTAPNYA